MDIRHSHTNTQHPSAGRVQSPNPESNCLVTSIMRDFILECPAPTQRFLSAVVTGMEKYQHHATHIALGAIAELLRVNQLDAVTRSAIAEIIQAVNHHC